MRNRPFTVLLALALTSATGAAAFAQHKPPAQQKPLAPPMRCLEGRTASGECVDPDLAQSARQSAIVYAIPKLSYSSPPYLPSEDYGFYALRDHHEISNLFGFPPISPGTTGFFRNRP